MLRGAVISPDRELADRLVGSLLETHRIGIVRRLDAYPNVVELPRFLRAAAPEVIFMGIDGRQAALETSKHIEELAPGTQIVAVNRTCDQQTLLETMRVGIREFLSPPFERNAVHECLKRVEELVSQNPPAFEGSDSVFAFLPAKPGAGTTTVAVNTSLALARVQNNPTLLIDMDLNSGLVGFMLSMNNPQYSIVDAAENALELDENLWPKIISTKDNLDILPVGKLSPGFRIEATQIRHILSFARRHYSTICIDLSGMMERYAVEILHEARRVFLVA